MLELFSYGVTSLWLEMARVNMPLQNTANQTVAISKWQAGLPQLLAPPNSDLVLKKKIEAYLEDLQNQGLLIDAPQGIWFQSEFMPLVGENSTMAMPAASLTKIATTLASLHHWGINHQWETIVGASGPIENGVLKGDLVITAIGDPFFMWEEAIALGNSLSQLGLKQVTGNLIITGPFVFNYESEPIMAGEFLREAINANTWSRDIQSKYSKMAKGTAKPKITVAGNVQYVKTPPQSKPLVRHLSPQLIYILRQMNVESDNKLADLLTTELGGVKIVEQQAIWSTGVPTAEIKLQNGSGLTDYNFISPRASSALFMAVQRALQGSNWNIADLFPVGGQDQGTLEERRLPKGTVVKTGTLDDVIALAGVLPTRDQGLVWFTLVNRGTDWYSLRSAQDRLLQDLTKLWGGAIAPGIQPHITMKNLVLGEPQRNQIINSLSDSNRQ